MPGGHIKGGGVGKKTIEPIERAGGNKSNKQIKQTSTGEPYSCKQSGVEGLTARGGAHDDREGRGESVAIAARLPGWVQVAVHGGRLPLQREAVVGAPNDAADSGGGRPPHGGGGGRAPTKV